MSLHCKKSWRKTSPAWPDDAVLKYQGDGTLFRYADQVNPTSSYEEDGILRRHWHSAKFSDNFPSTFRPFSINFPTKESKSNWHQREANPHPSWLHSYTIPLRHTNFLSMWCVALSISLIAFSLLLSFLSTLIIFVITVLSFASTVDPFVSTVLSFLSTLLEGNEYFILF